MLIFPASLMQPGRFLQGSLSLHQSATAVFKHGGWRGEWQMNGMCSLVSRTAGFWLVTGGLAMCWFCTHKIRHKPGEAYQMGNSLHFFICWQFWKIGCSDFHNNVGNRNSISIWDISESALKTDFMDKKVYKCRFNSTFL